MRTKNSLIIVCFFQLISLTNCGAQIHDINETLSTKTAGPFDYYVPNIYVFSVKAENALHQHLYADTLGLMCTQYPFKIAYGNSGQNSISWVYFSKKNGSYVLNDAKVNNSYTGVKSDAEELFLHPPREMQYTILEICPFPYLHFPLFIGKKWDWDLEVGDQYCPSDTIRWKGNEIFSSHYEVTDSTLINLPMGKLYCYHIHATNTSKLGTSSSDFYYSYKYGMVKLCYKPLDKTNVELNLLTSFYDKNLFDKIFWTHKNDSIPFLINK